MDTVQSDIDILWSIFTNLHDTLDNSSLLGMPFTTYNK